MSLDALRQLNGVLLGGHYEHLNRTQWLQAVQDSFNQAPLALTSSVHLQVGQSIYGPSAAPIESQRYENQNCIQVVALGATKAMHEFLVLHYLATDSAQGWEEFLSQCIPNGNWMPTTSRRAMLMNMFDKCHIAPSYRRMPH